MRDAAECAVSDEKSVLTAHFLISGLGSRERSSNSRTDGNRQAHLLLSCRPLAVRFLQMIRVEKT